MKFAGSSATPARARSSSATFAERPDRPQHAVETREFAAVRRDQRLRSGALRAAPPARVLVDGHARARISRISDLPSIASKCVST